MAAEGIIERFGNNNRQIKCKLLDARAATGAGPAIKLEGKNKHSFLISCAGGTAELHIQFSPDAGVTWVNFRDTAFSYTSGESEGQGITHFDADMLRLNITAISGATVNVWYRGREE